MIRYLARTVSSIKFYIRNTVASAGLTPIKPVKLGDLTFRGYEKADYSEVSAILYELNDGASFSGLRKQFYGWRGDRCLVVALRQDHDGSTAVIGINMYYFNRRDVVERTIHEAFIGVRLEESGKGVATLMRRLALGHFSRTGLAGVSTRISEDNLASLNSAIRLRFVVVERYEDCASAKNRLYLTRLFTK